MKEEENEEISQKDDEEDCQIMCCHDGENIHHGDMRKKVLIALSEGLEGRGNVVMTRLNDDDLAKIDALVEVEVFKSRSEASAFFIKEGINARKDLFDKVMKTVDQIKELKEQAKESLGKSKEP
jgi:Arc/MetJ-type ribon-helix-helix transcriptional regulator